MTTKKILAVLLTVIGTATLAEANDSTYFKNLRIIPQGKSDSYKLIYQASTQEPVYVSIKNGNNDLLLAKRFGKNKGFILPLNLEKLESGTYEVEVKSKSGVVTKTINHTSQSDFLREKIFIQKNKNQFRIVGFDLGVTELDLLVYDQSDLVFKDTITTQELVSKSYDLGEIRSGLVKILVYSNGDRLIETEIDLK